MAFATDDIYRLGGSQRAKLQYHILAQYFPLVCVDEQDKADLEAFAAQAETEVAQLWLARMRWPQGHEKMVTFGQALCVDDKRQGGRVRWFFLLHAVCCIWKSYTASRFPSTVRRSHWGTGIHPHRRRALSFTPAERRRGLHKGE